MTTSDIALPTRGKRPKNRRALIVRAASELFYRVGYGQVTMADVAAAVEVGPSALYRHFSGKQELLAAAVADGLRPFREVAADELDAIIDGVSAVALQERRVGVLWQRESRHLSSAVRATLRADVRTGVLSYAAYLGENRSRTQAEFLAWCTFAVLTSPSYHRLDLPGPDYRALLAAMAREVSTVDVPAIEVRAAEEPAERMGVQSRREALLRTAATVFAENGYSTASIQDIGAGVDIAGPSIYHHFDSKLDLLVALVTRGGEWLQRDMAHELGQSRDPADALDRLIQSYAGFALSHRELVDVLITEVAQLPEPHRHRARQTQHDYIAEWVHLLRSMRPELADVPARIRVQATLTVINDIARTPHFRRAENIEGALHDVGRALLWPR